MFQNREEAGRQLAARLAQYRDDAAAMILALPRGGVAVAYSMSLELRLPLDVFITRKLGAPENPEFAIGAVSESGMVYVNHNSAELCGVSQADLAQLVREQRQEISRRQVLYREGRSLPSLCDRTVLLVDDGIATGATFFASVHGIRDLKPHRLVAAIPVGPRETLHEVRRLVDDLVVLEIPDPFFAVGNHYVNFAQVQDKDVIRYLDLAKKALYGDSKCTSEPLSLQ